MRPLWLGGPRVSLPAKNKAHSECGTSTRCFDPFPFPDLSELAPALVTHLRSLGEQLDAHRKERQARHPELTLTQMYNVLEKLRAGAALSEKDKAVHDKGLVSVLKQIHDDIDEAVAQAYGWPSDLSDEAILERLVKLNRERAAEERRGKIRWLRPEFQAPDEAAVEEAVEEAELALALGAEQKAKARAWPKQMPEQIRLVRDLLQAAEEPVPPEALKAHFKKMGKNQRAQLDQILASLVTVGAARRLPDGRYGV